MFWDPCEIGSFGFWDLWGLGPGVWDLGFRTFGVLHHWSFGVKSISLVPVVLIRYFNSLNFTHFLILENRLLLRC